MGKWSQFRMKTRSSAEVKFFLGLIGKPINFKQLSQSSTDPARMYK